MTLTNGDLKAIKGLMEITLDEKLDEKLDQKFDEKLGKYPNKDEFYKETTRILKKLDDLETDKDLLSHRVSIHSNEIETLNKIHPNFSHAS